MAALLDIVKKGSTDRSVTIRIIDSTDGTPETGVVFNTSGIDLWYRREGSAKVSITEADLTTPALTDAHADGGFLHIGDGEYRLDLPDAAFATGANHVDIGGTVTGMVVIGGRVRLVDYDPEDTVRLGLTALPNAAADAAGGLIISDAGGLDADTMNSNVSAILVDTGTTLDNLVDDLETRLGTPSDLGSGASIAANLADIEAQTDDIGVAGAGLSAIPWNADWDAEVQSEVADALNAAQTEPTGVPAANESLADKINYLFMAWRNKKTVTASKKTYFDDSDAAEFEADLSDDGTTYTESEINAL